MAKFTRLLVPRDEITGGPECTNFREKNEPPTQEKAIIIASFSFPSLYKFHRKNNTRGINNVPPLAPLRGKIRAGVGPLSRKKNEGRPLFLPFRDMAHIRTAPYDRRSAD